MLRNVTRKLLKSNLADGACAPIGCALTLISGMTMYCPFKIPTAKDTLYNIVQPLRNPTYVATYIQK
eukprot:4918096-Ditylum_brightwellii.AAC.1